MEKLRFLHKVVKSCLTLQNGNASAERSLSDNKNTLILQMPKHSNEQKNLRLNIGLKRKSEMPRLINGFNKSK